MKQINPFKKLFYELHEANKGKEKVKIIAKNKKDQRIAGNLTKLVNFMDKYGMDKR